VVALFDYLPRGNALSDSEFKVRHQFLQWVLLLHLPGLLVFGLFRGFSLNECVEAIVVPAAFLVLSRLLQSRRFAALALTAGLSTCSVVLVVLSGGAIEAHFHFFVTIGLIALYQDWVPFLWNIGFTVLSHGIGSLLLPDDLFAHLAGQHRPWTWALIHGIAVLAASVGVMMLLAFTENDHQRTVELRAELVEGNRKRFTADLLVNLARRNQNLIYRQLELLNRLEDHERDADQLSHLFQLDHLATRIRRNAESLLVLSGEEPARKWGGSVLLVDVVRAAIAEIEELDRVDFSVDEALQVSGRAVADATHLLAELIENAVHFSPPGLSVMVRTRPYLPSPGAHVLTIEDWGVGMPAGDLADANDLLRRPREVDLASAQRLGLHVVARLAGRYGIRASLESTPGGGVTAVVLLPAELFTVAEAAGRTPVGAGVGGRRPYAAEGLARRTPPGLTGPGSGPGRPGSHGPGTHGPNVPAGSGLNGSGLNGSALNGPGLNGSGPNGSGPNGSGLNGSGLNGSGLNGSGLNGSGLNGSGLNGSGMDGSGLNGSGLSESGPNGSAPNGSGLSGSGPNGSDPNGSGLNGTRTSGAGGVAGSGPNGSGPTGSHGDLTGPGAGTGLLDGPLDGPGPAGPPGPGGATVAGSFEGPTTGGLPSRNPGAALNGPPETPGLRSRSSDPETLLGDDLDELGRGVGYFGRGSAPDAPLPAPRPDAPLPAPRIDQPARTDQPGRTDRDDTWATWWPLPPGDTTPGDTARGDGGLRRRTPQANLADELRRSDEEAPAAPIRPRRDPAETRSALSRFQATQRAAREGQDRKDRP
jgi:signal transduction histidine kinase